MSRRTERVSELLREELGQILLHEVSDPRLGGLISITQIDLSPDLLSAKVSVSVMAPPPEQADAIRALNAAAAFFHRSLKPRLDLRRVPFLTFHLDSSIAEGAEMLAHIDAAIRGEGGARSEG